MKDHQKKRTVQRKKDETREGKICMRRMSGEERKKRKMAVGESREFI